MNKSEYGVIDRFFWELIAILFKSWSGLMILLFVFGGVSAALLVFFKQPPLCLALAAILTIFGLWIFSLNRLAGVFSDWFIRKLEIPSRNPFTVKGFTLILGSASLVVSITVAYLLSLGSLILVVSAFLFFYFLTLFAYCFETDFGNVDLNNITNRFGEIDSVNEDGSILLRDGRKLRMAVLSGNLGGAREPQELVVFHRAFTEILEILALARSRVGSAFSIIEFANRSPILASEIRGKGEIQKAVAQQTRAMRQTTYQQVVLLVLEEAVFEKMVAAFREKAEMTIAALSQKAVLAYLGQIFSGQSTLFALRQTDLGKKELKDWPGVLPQQLFYEGETVVFDGQRALGLIQVFPQSAEDLVFLQNMARQFNLQLKITVLPTAHLWDEIDLRHRSRDFGPESVTAKALYEETFAAKDSRVLLRIMVGLVIQGKDRVSCQQKISAVSQVLAQLEHRILTDSALSRAAESFALLPVIPAREIRGFWDTLGLGNITLGFRQQRLAQVLPWQEISSGKVAPYLTAVREEGATDDTSLAPSPLSVPIGYGVKTETKRPFFYSLDSLQQGEAVFRLVFGAVGWGKTILERSIMARLFGVIPQVGVVLKAGDPEWPRLVEALGGRTLADSMLGSIKGEPAGEFRRQAKEGLAWCYENNSVLLYVANSASLSPAHEIGLLIFLQELIAFQNQRLRQRGEVEQRASTFFVDEAALVTAAWGTLNKYAKESVDLLATVFRNARDWKMAISLIFQSLADVYGNTDVRNPLVVVLRSQQVPFGQTADKLFFAGGALEEDLKRAGFPGFKCEKPTADNLIGLILDTRYKTGTFWWVKPRRGSHNLIYLPLTDAELQFAPLRVKVDKGDGRIIV